MISAVCDARPGRASQTAEISHLQYLRVVRQIAFFSVFFRIRSILWQVVLLEIKFHFCNEASFCFSAAIAPMGVVILLYQLLVCQHLFLKLLILGHFFYWDSSEESPSLMGIGHIEHDRSDVEVQWHDLRGRMRTRLNFHGKTLALT